MVGKLQKDLRDFRISEIYLMRDKRCTRIAYVGLATCPAFTGARMRARALAQALDAAPPMPPCA